MLASVLRPLSLLHASTHSLLLCRRRQLAQAFGEGGCPGRAQRAVGSRCVRPNMSLESSPKQRRPSLDVDNGSRFRLGCWRADLGGGKPILQSCAPSAGRWTPRSKMGAQSSELVDGSQRPTACRGRQHCEVGVGRPCIADTADASSLPRLSVSGAPGGRPTSCSKSEPTWLVASELAQAPTHMALLWTTRCASGSDVRPGRGAPQKYEVRARSCTTLRTPDRRRRRLWMPRTDPAELVQMDSRPPAVGHKKQRPKPRAERSSSDEVLGRPRFRPHPEDRLQVL